MKTETKRSNMAIWKINSEHPELIDLPSEEKISKIIQLYNDDEDNSVDFTEVSLGISALEEKNIRLFHKPRISQGWREFIGEYVEGNNENNTEIFFTKNNDLLCFIYDEDDVFLITAGAGYHAIQEYIDDSFPLEVAKKLFIGEFNRAEIRNLTGPSYFRSENYRRNYSFSRQEAFGKVWKSLSGQIDAAVIKKVPELELVIDPKRKVNAEMKSSFTFRKSVSLKEIVNLINALQKLPKISKAKRERFKFLDSLHEVKIKKQKERLWNLFFEKIRKMLQTGDFNDATDFDFCHPSEVFDFLSGCRFTLGRTVISDADCPTSEDVLKALKTHSHIDTSTADKFKASFEKVSFSFYKDDTSKAPISTHLYKYFHGEVVLDSKNYFLVDGKWYEAQQTFLDTLLEDFLSGVFDDSTLTEAIPFTKWKKTDDEGAFNLAHKTKAKFYYGDKVFLVSNRGQIELFDLLYVDNDILYIIHVKDGFGASMRDACSQIQIAAEVIEEDWQANKEKLREYYKSWLANKKTLTEDDFVRLFEKKRVYVLACSTNQKFIKKVFKNNTLYSNIAKFEILGIKHDFRIKGYNFQMQHINKM